MAEGAEQKTEKVTITKLETEQIADLAGHTETVEFIKFIH